MIEYAFLLIYKMVDYVHFLIWLFLKIALQGLLQRGSLKKVYKTRFINLKKHTRKRIVEMNYPKNALIMN